MIQNTECGQKAFSETAGYLIMPGATIHSDNPSVVNVECVIHITKKPPL